MKISAVLLAAGQSKRFKQADSKLTMAFKNGPSLLEQQIQLLKKINVEEKTLVLNSITEKAAQTFLKNDSNIKPVLNSFPEKGLHYSIRLALEASSTDSVGWLIWLADLYDLKQTHFQAVIKEIQNSKAEFLIAPTFNKLRGHPVFIPASYKDRILSEPDGDYGCRYLWRETEITQQMNLPWEDDSVLADLDT